VALAMGGCTGSNPEALLDTAQLEERQENVEHARQLYQRIIEEHPESKYADQARERLAELEKEDN
jgi:TolA-binding protein